MKLHTVPVWVTITAEDEQDAIDRVGDLLFDLGGSTPPNEPGHVAWYRVGEMKPIRYEAVCYDHQLQGVEHVLPGTRMVDSRYVDNNVRVVTVECYAASLSLATERLRMAYGFRLGTVELL